MSRLLRTSAIAGAVGLGYAMAVRGDIAPDLRIGRRMQTLGPFARYVAAPPDVVFDVIAGPYLAEHRGHSRRK